MKRFITSFVAVGFMLGMIATAQEQQAGAAEDQAMVRFIQAAPNADVEQVLLTAAEGDTGAAVSDFGELGYTQIGDYVAVPAGTYEVLVTLEPVEGADAGRVVSAESFDASAGGFYTVALMGLVVPQDLEQQQAEDADDGFMGWLRDLFTDDAADRETLDLRVLVIDDEATAQVGEEELMVRVLHAAPGTDAVSLAVVRADQDENGEQAAEDGEQAAADAEIAETVEYGNVSGYATFEQGDRLEVRTQDGEAVIVDLSQHDLSSGMLHTVVVTGTPVEEVPVEALVASTEPRERDTEEAADADAAATTETEDAATAEADDAAATAEADDAAERDPAVATAPAGTRLATADPDHAMVRFVHAAPNAEANQILLTTEEDATTGVSLEDFAGTAYMETTDYVAIPAGTYDIVVSLGATEEASVAEVVPAETLNASAGEYYTIALVGLMVPDGATAEQDGGFLDWLQGLFTAENGDGDQLGLRVMVLDDDLTAFFADQQETQVRIVHAAPGTDAVSLVVVRADAEAAAERDVDVVHTVGYGDVSGYSSIDAAAGSLEVRIEGSEAVITDLADLDLQPGMIHTIFVTGTPVEEVPLDAMVLSNTWAEQEGEPAN